MATIQTLFPRDQSIDEHYCFVLMPFRKEFDDIYQKSIRPSAEASGLTCRRADEIFTNKIIMGDIWNSIQKSGIIVADLTTRNPNVMYELGLAHAMWRRTILISQNVDDVPFDLRNLRIISYQNKNDQDMYQLSFRLQEAIYSVRATEPADPTTAIRNEFMQNYAECGSDIGLSKYSRNFLIERTRDHIILAGPTLSFWLGQEQNRTELFSLIMKGVRVSLFLSDRATMKALKGTGDKELRKSAEHIADFKRALPPRYKKQLKDAFHFGVSTLSAVISDPDSDRGVAVISPRWGFEHNSNTRMYTVLEKSKQTQMFSHFISNVEFMMNISDTKTAEEILVEYDKDE
ncbi:MAG: hypothetical protein AAGI52_00820 [Bacteroidota bacterium]